MGKSMRVWLGLWAAMLGTVAHAGFVDFETVPGGVPSSGLVINTQYRATQGMTFQLSNGASPILAQVGPPIEGFASVYGDDTPAPGQNVGQFFLTSPQLFQPVDLIVTYFSLVQAVSGVILDIDGGEAWTIKALNANNDVVGTVVLAHGDPGTGDGVASIWSFSDASADISAVRISYTGSDPQAGHGWDNFSATGPSAVPEPGSLVLFLIGLAGLRQSFRRVHGSAR